MTKSDQPLKTEVVGGRLIISVGIKTLARAFEQSNDAHQYNERDGSFEQIYQVTDPQIFAQDVAKFLNNEEEDGSTPLNLLLDRACMGAIEDGSLGINES